MAAKKKEIAVLTAEFWALAASLTKKWKKSMCR